MTLVLEYLEHVQSLLIPEGLGVLVLGCRTCNHVVSICTISKVCAIQSRSENSPLTRSAWRHAVNISVSHNNFIGYFLDKLNVLGQKFIF